MPVRHVRLSSTTRPRIKHRRPTRSKHCRKGPSSSGCWATTPCCAIRRWRAGRGGKRTFAPTPQCSPNSAISRFRSATKAGALRSRGRSRSSPISRVKVLLSFDMTSTRSERKIASSGSSVTPLDVRQYHHRSSRCPSNPPTPPTMPIASPYQDTKNSGESSVQCRA